ncbi:MAG: hypothetical protein KDB61_10215, partial [Planctomycetes bacterium]|nr:hypothetical protein [Planctomycetota bacterium]
MKRILSCACLAFFVLFHFAGAAPAADFDYEGEAKRALARHGMEGATTETFDFSDYCNRGFVHLEVGLFDLYMEQDSFDDKQAKRMFGLAQSLVTMQRRWLDWVDPAGEDHKEIRDIAKELEAFLGKVNLGPAVNAAKQVTTPGGGGGFEKPQALDLWTVIEVSKEDLETFRKLNGFLQADGGLGLTREAKPERMVLYPKRARYVEVIALAGWARPVARPSMWSTGIFTWTNFYVDDWRFMSLQ